MLIPMRVDYAVRMLVFLAMQPGERFTPTTSIAQRQHIPEPYLLRISADLARAGLVESRRGPGGGVRLARPASKITVGTVVDCVDHTFAAIDCLTEPDACLISGACSQRELWGDVEQMLLDYLFRIKIEDLVKKQKQLEGASELDLVVGKPRR
jgi:Rrf2 family nitric oxide-sensitive transcriptional repressor